MDVDYELDVDEINERWSELAAIDIWSQLIMKQPEDQVGLIAAAPRTGTWGVLPGGRLEYRRLSSDWHGLQDENELFFMRVYGAGDYLFKGADPVSYTHLDVYKRQHQALPSRWLAWFVLVDKPCPRRGRVFWRQ